jgi:hypothetical protein
MKFDAMPKYYDKNDTKLGFQKVEYFFFKNPLG